MNRKERRAAQKLSGSASVAAAAARGAELFAAGLQHHQAGQLAEAARLYRQALAAEPRQADSHHLLGVIAHQQGRHTEAVDSIRRALAIAPEMPQAHNNLGLALRALGRLNDAVGHFARAAALKPDYAAAHNNLGAALVAQGDWERAAWHARAALSLSPTLFEAGVNLGRALLRLGRTNEALDLARRAVVMRDTKDTRELFLDCAMPTRFTADDGSFRKLLLRALTEGWARPAELAPAAVSILLLSPPIKSGVDRATAAWPERVGAGELLDRAALDAIASDDLLRCLLVSCPAGSPELEMLLTNLRAALLSAAGDSAADLATSDHLAFWSALARQCFNTEYVFAITGDERTRLEHLRARLEAALADGTPVPPLWIVAVAAYEALSWLQGREQLLGHDWPAPVQDLLTQQVREPAQEQALRETIPTLTDLNDDVSRAVRGQYEESPYPRWIRAVDAPPLLPDELQNRPIDVLSAGCGTGMFAIELARQAPQARILAVDLSLTSLSYAKRMAQAAGLTNIEFAQADIMRLGGIGRSFDVIESGGVLHHMADTWSGWRALLPVLRPAGLMRIALYSEIGRRNFAPVRDFIAARGYRPVSDDIRRCREALMSAPDGTAEKKATRWGDFGSMSGCRDLLFHVQEQRVTLPQIKAFLAENDLQLVRFELAPNLMQGFRRRHPGEAAAADLDLWHAYEAENPDTFAAMYQFLVRRRA